MSDTPNLALPYLAAGQAQKHVTLNKALDALDALVQLAVTSAALATPPGSPAEGDRYIVAASPTGAWAGQAGSVAVYQTDGWVFYTPQAGWVAWDRATSALLVYDDGDWTDLSPAITVLQNLALLGIGTTADSANPLSMVGAGALLAAKTAGAGGTGDLTVTLNKEAAADTLQILLQRGFSTRAILGLLGDDDLTVKVSPDGAAFFTGISIDKDTGHVGLGGATADANNALIVKGLAMLFDAATDDLRFTFNKAGAGDDCALTFQSGYSARARVGLLGSDDFTFKVSPNGSTYYDALVLDKDDGTARLPSNPKFRASLNYDPYIAANAWTKVPFNVADYDPGSDFSTSNNHFTAPVDGLYVFGAQVGIADDGTPPTTCFAAMYVNGSAAQESEMRSTAVVDDRGYANFSLCRYLTAGTTVDVRVYFNANDSNLDAASCQFWGHFVP